MPNFNVCYFWNQTHRIATNIATRSGYRVMIRKKSIHFYITYIKDSLGNIESRQFNNKEERLIYCDMRNMKHTTKKKFYDRVRSIRHKLMDELAKQKELCGNHT